MRRAIAAILAALLCFACIQAVAKTAPKKSTKAKTSKTGSAAAATHKSPPAKPAAPKVGSVPAPKAVTSAKTTPSETAKAEAADPAPAVPAGAFTSLIVDATGFKLDKCMSPKIVRGDGSVVWGKFSKLTDEQYDIIQDIGMVAYASSLEEAAANKRAGAAPLVVKAIDTTGQGMRSDAVVTDDDAAKILSEDEKSGFLAKFNVIYIKNENPPPPPQPEASAEPDQAPPPPDQQTQQ